MKTGASEVLLLTLVMGVVIFFCRAFPFLFFRGRNETPGGGGEVQNSTGKQRGGRAALLSFVEKTVPPAAMTVLAFNAMASPVHGNPREAIPVLVAAAVTAAVHLWRRNPLLSIFGGTALYMVLERVVAW